MLQNSQKLRPLVWNWHHWERHR